jgi:hypothetical protein
LPVMIWNNTMKCAETTEWKQNSDSQFLCRPDSPRYFPLHACCCTLKSKSQKHLLPAKVTTQKKHADCNIWEACRKGKCNSLKKWREGVEEWDFFLWPQYSSISPANVYQHDKRKICIQQEQKALLCGSEHQPFSL